MTFEWLSQLKSLWTAWFFLVFVAIIGKRSYLRTMFLRSVVKSSEP